MHLNNDSSPPATAEWIAAMEFAGVKELAALPKETRNKRAYEIANTAYKWVQVAMHILTLDKPELIGLVRKNYQVLGETLVGSPAAEEAARDLIEIIQSGMARLAVAVAVVETSPDFDPDAGEPLPEDELEDARTVA